MFGLIERGRLAMYEATLRQAEQDCDGVLLFESAALMTGMVSLGQAAAAIAGRTGTFQFQGTLGETIESIPSKYLSGIDAILVHAIEAPKKGENQVGYQMLTLINGLVYMRIVEVSRASLAARAHAFRRAALAFAEPAYELGLRAMISSANRPDAA